MKKIIYLCVLFFSANSLSDEWHQGVQGVCDQSNKLFKINYIFGYNEKGKNLVDSKSKESESSCLLGANKYSINSEFKRGHPEGKGRCGAHTYVKVFVFQNGNEIFSKRLLSDCHHSTSYISTIEISESGKISANWAPGLPY